MELSSYFSLVGRYKYIILLIVAATVVASYFLVKNLPDEYISSTQVSTGIVDASKHLLDKDGNAAVQQEQVSQEFNNLTEIIKLKKLIDNVSYQLIIHDLSSPTPFRKLKGKFAEMSQAAKEHALEVFKAKLQAQEPLSLYDKDENALNELLISMKYDERSIRKNLTVERDVESDFITISYTSENPQLSAFAVNTLCSEFLDYYVKNVKNSETNAISFLKNLLDKRRAVLDGKKDSLQQYKIQNGILNLEDQSKSINAQIINYEDKKLQAEKDIASYEGAVKHLENRFTPGDRQYIESSISRYNQAVTNTEEQLHILNDQYVHSGFDPKYKVAVDSLQKQLSAQINNGSDKYITNPQVAKDDIVKEKLSLDVSLDLARYSVTAIDRELAMLRGQFNRLVPYDAVIKTFEQDIATAQQEYLDALKQYNQLLLESNFSIKLTQVQPATPNTAEPSKKILLMALCGIASFVICLLVLFVLFYLDDTIHDPAELVHRTQLPLLGSLNMIPGPKPDLRKLWDVENRQRMQQFKELLRSVRFEIDQELKGEKILAITSLNAGEGKTLVITALAYAYSAINKKVLLIDGNFDNPTITKTVQPKMFVEDYFRANAYIERENSSISVLGNRGGDVTLLEINDERSVRQEMDDLRSRYDIILIDLPPLDSLNKSKEWILFANKVVAVFESHGRIAKDHTEYNDYLRHLNTKFAGWVLNKVHMAKKKRKKR